jgi:flagellar basal body-associated protein FliL
MENASQALIIAGGILIAIIVLSVGVYLFVNYSKVSESYEKLQENKEINKFNTNFTKFKDRTDITAQEIITLKNFVTNYNKQNETNVKVEYPYNTMKDAEFIKNYSVNNDGIIYFKCTDIEYENDGRVKRIEFQMKN